MKQYRCERKNCNLVFDRPSKLSRHQLLHTGVKNYRCPAENCTKSYSTPSHLNRHMKTHFTTVQENPAYRCSYPSCQAQYNTKWGLRRHEKKHDDLNYYCDSCDMYFKLECTYLKHKDQHDKKSSQACKKCGKSYTHTTRQKYLRHESRCGDILVRVQRDPEDWFVCDRCGSQFNSKVKIGAHVVACYSLHSSFFVCGYQLCTKVFLYKRNLRYHINRHHSVIKYECPQNSCRRELLHGKSWKKHVERHQSVGKEIL